MQETEHPTPRRRRIVVPSRNDALLSGLTEVAGGPLGKRTAPGIVTPGFFTVERVLVIITVLAALLALLFKDHCRRSGWTTPDQYTTACFSAFPNDFRDKGLAVFFPYFGHSLAYSGGPLAGLAAGITGRLAGGAGSGAPGQLAYFDLNALLVIAAWGVAVVAVSRSNPRRPWDAAVVAASPLLVFAALAGGDLSAAALLAAAIWLFARRNSLLAGVLTGLAFSVHPYAGLFLPAVALLAVRSRRYVPLLETAAGAVLAWAVVTLPVLVINPGSYGAFWGQWTGAAAPSPGSLYNLYNVLAARLGHEPIGNGTAAALSAGLLAVAVAAVALFALRSRNRPHLAQLLVLLVGSYWLVSLSSSPQQLVWLVPLLALARPSWRMLLSWQAVAILVFLAWQLYLGRELGHLSPQHSIDAPYFILAILALMGATLVVMALVVRDVLRPGYDPVHRSGGPDPLAGELAAAGAAPPRASAARALPLEG
ncbi:MAG TPA: glycosyltransferase 87 family protein [Micrococcaceae bacterium]